MVTSGATFTDDFNRANENPLSDSGAWSTISSGYGNLQIISLIAQNTSGNCAEFVSTPAFSNDHIATTTIAGTSGCGVVVRQSVNGDGYLLFMNSTTALTVFAVTGGSSFSSIGTFTVSAIIFGDLRSRF